MTWTKEKSEKLVSKQQSKEAVECLFDKAEDDGIDLPNASTFYGLHSTKYIN